MMLIWYSKYGGMGIYIYMECLFINRWWLYSMYTIGGNGPLIDVLISFSLFIFPSYEHTHF